MKNKIHFSIATHDVAASVQDYSKRLEQDPDVYVENEYALWKTSTINFSIRYDLSLKPGELRHLGWQDDTAKDFTEEKDINGIVWERFSEQQQIEEIKNLWPEAI